MFADADGGAAGNQPLVAIAGTYLLINISGYSGTWRQAGVLGFFVS